MSRSCLSARRTRPARRIAYDFRNRHRAPPARTLPSARRRRAVRHRTCSGRAQDGRLVRPLQHNVQLPDQPRHHAERGLDGGGRLVFPGRGDCRIFWDHRRNGLLSDHGDAGGRLRNPRSGRDPRRLRVAGCKADPLAIAHARMHLLVRVPDPCRRIGHRRGARENDRRYLSADWGQRDLWVHPGVRRGDRLRIAQGAGASRVADQGRRIGLSVCAVRAS